jgi:hypothetical protein
LHLFFDARKPFPNILDAIHDAFQVHFPPEVTETFDFLIDRHLEQKLASVTRE